MSRDYETLYYEQQANFTESNGMLTQERDRAIARCKAAEAGEAEEIEKRLKVEAENAALREAGKRAVGLLEPIAHGSVAADAGVALHAIKSALVALQLLSQGHGEEIIDAQHDETGRMWQGKRKDLPPRFREVTMEGGGQ